MLEVAVHGKNKGTLQSYLTPIPVYCIRKSMSKRNLRICSNRFLFHLCSKQTLDKNAAWV